MILLYCGECMDKLTNSLFVLFITDEANTIHLKCDIAPFSDPCTVLDHQVPVFICDKDALASAEWDITTQQVGKSMAPLPHPHRCTIVVCPLILLKGFSVMQGFQ